MILWTRPLVGAALLAGLVGCADLRTVSQPAAPREPVAPEFAPPAVEPAALASIGEVPTLPSAEATTGRVSWYGRRFAGRPTASGETFDPGALTMAHREWPFGTPVRVTNEATGASVVVRVNDRGPFVDGRVADLSYAAARRLGMVERGVIVARLERLTPGAAAEAPLADAAAGR